MSLVMAESPERQPQPGDFPNVPVVWLGFEEANVSTCNQYLGQFAGRDEFILTFGEITPPPLLGTPEERLEQAKQLSYVPVRVIARLGMTRYRVEELIKVLQETLSNYDQADDQGAFSQ
jgi:hypothetical protein